MAFFVGAGIISSEVVRKETRNGVLAVFRLETGAPNDRKLWIDVEAWGQLAGTIAHHGTNGRGVLVSGRLTYKTWRDRKTGDSRHRLVVTALDVDLQLDSESSMLLPSSVVVAGTIETVYPKRPTPKGVVHSFRLVSGRAGSKTGRLWFDVEHWCANGVRQASVSTKLGLSVSGALDYRATPSSQTDGSIRGLFLRAESTSSATEMSE